MALRINISLALLFAPRIVVNLEKLSDDVQVHKVGHTAREEEADYSD